MTREVQQTYLETQITTATPQRLRLLLIEGAIRFARQTQEHWCTGQDEAALESLIRCRDIVSELLSGVHLDDSPLARQVGALYGYLFSALTEAQQTRDATLLAAVIRVLNEERETWRQVCEQLPDRPVPAHSANFASREELAPSAVMSVLGTGEAFSIEA
jgi:flagellar secretion chaperone FliS